MQPATEALALVCVLALGVACGPWAGGMQDGEWYETGKHPAFPGPRFMVGVGYGDTLKDADDMARGELTKNFTAKVTTVSMETDSYKQKDTSQGSEAVRQFESRTFTRVKGMAVLEDVKIAERVQVGPRHYALAVVDAQALRAKWGRKLASLDQSMEESLAGGAGGNTSRLQGIAGALRILPERRALEAQLRAIGGAVPADPRDYGALFQEMQSLLKEQYPLRVTGNDAELLRLANEALTAEWLVIADTSAPESAVLVTVEWTVRVQNQGDSTEILYTVQAQATQNGQLLAGRRLADRILHRDEEMGRQKALLEVRDRLVKPFAADLANAVLGQL